MTTDQRPRGGRPRDTQLDQRVRNACIAVLAERGLAGARIDTIAGAAGVPKSTIYRRWSGLAELVLDAMAEAVGHDDAPPSTGDPAADLRALATAVGSLLTGPRGLTLLQIGVQLMDDPQLSASYRARLIDRNRELAVRLIEEGRATGRFRHGVDARVLVDQAIGGLVYRRLILHEDVTRADLDMMVDDLLDRLGPG